MNNINEEKNTLTKGNEYDFFDIFDELFKNQPTRYNQNMKTDIVEHEHNYILEVDVPGCDKKDITIDFDNGYITITAERKEYHNEHEGKNIRKEKFYGQTSRTFYIGDVEEKYISAKLENGILYINIPKESKSEEKRHIEIK